MCPQPGYGGAVLVAGSGRSGDGRANGCCSRSARNRLAPSRTSPTVKRWLFPSSLRQQTMDAMRERLDASDDPDAESAFWDGFNHGMRAYTRRFRPARGRTRPTPAPAPAPASPRPAPAPCTRRSGRLSSPRGCERAAGTIRLIAWRYAAPVTGLWRPPPPSRQGWGIGCQLG
jgi:hypothetical protein